jgi:hypothetical protein
MQTAYGSVRNTTFSDLASCDQALSSVLCRYLSCMKSHDNAHALCREETASYLKCRMDKGLMTEEKISNFGLEDPIDYNASKAAHEV